MTGSASGRLPGTTYRLQLHKDFTFARAERVLDYLKRLGITDLYLSPIWAAMPGSTHGYDVTDHAQVNPELGGRKGLERLSAAARARGMGVIVDFVPNHMGVGGGHNPYWEDVLEHGQASRYAHFFDIDWRPLKRSLEGKVLLPVLGDQYGRVLERHELKVQRQGGRFGLHYYERVFPLSPRSLAPLLHRAEQLCELSEASDVRAELASLSLQAGNLPNASASPDAAERASRARETAVIQRRLEGIAQASPSIARALDVAVRELNSNVEQLDHLVQQQNYRLAFWRVASEQINYRRFFDINELAALRMEDPRVFEWAHRLLLELVQQGVVTGIRLDHTDGLFDPAGYFQALQEGAARALGVTWTPGSPDPLPLYVVAEKILEPGEALPDGWPIHGTTGYDFLAQLNGVFVDDGNAQEMSALYRRVTGDPDPYGETLHDTKELILRSSLASELNGLAERLERLAEHDLRWRDFTLSTLRTALREVIACFPVYRTYVRQGGAREPGDDAKIRHAVRDARALNRDLDGSVFDFLEAVLTVDAQDERQRQVYTDFAMTFQQLTGPVTAKGAEDTAFYRYVRLLSLNEVGSDPALFGTPPASFHRQTQERTAHWPHAMLAGSTHDTKRGEDTRARISVLSELPQTWAAYLSAWSRLSRPFEQTVQGLRGPQHWPGHQDTYALYQTMLGAWPLDGNLEGFQARLEEYAIKSAREAKLHTTWANPNAEYEGQLTGLIGGLLENSDFRQGLEELHARISPYGALNGLSAALVRLTAPGVPDTYQGSEGWNQSLVDPDNRRPVDYALLSRQLARLEKRHASAPLRLATELLEQYQDGAVKQLVVWAALQARQQEPELFSEGRYVPLKAGKYLLSFAREHQDRLAVVAVPRLSLTLTREQQPWPLGEVWGQRTLRLPRNGRYRNLLTGERFTVRGERLALAKLLEFFPLALLIWEASD
ncbi:malto-oligosyltrehalose synthase [Deinococcus sonorensis]|uniref:Malto-oligosyltrehalose synthase n=2 Tax=Deinococcus sonorensis TaxID=309891 RepID=A0AAU7U941_9DEIO